MCSFLFTDIDVNDFDYTNHYMKFRGPDATNSIQVNEYTIAHNILSMHIYWLYRTISYIR